MVSEIYLCGIYAGLFEAVASNTAIENEFSARG